MTVSDFSDVLSFLTAKGFTHLVWSGTETTVFVGSDPFPASSFKQGTRSRELLEDLDNQLADMPSFTLILEDRHFDLLEAGVLEAGN